jgi:hypothetical protein
MRILLLKPNAEYRIRECSFHQLSCSFHIVPGKVLRRESNEGYLRELITAKDKDIRMSKMRQNQSHGNRLLDSIHIVIDYSK